MCDRLTQLQDLIDQQAEHFCNCIGTLQQLSEPNKISACDRNNVENQQLLQDYSLLFSSRIAKTSKDIDIMIESLPDSGSSTELQIDSLKRLEKENIEVGMNLQQSVIAGETLLSKIQGALLDIGQAQLEILQGKS